MAEALWRSSTVMKSYEVLRAPFDGTVTARFVDTGALVQSSVTNQTSNQPVLTIADMSRLRVDVYVEQRDVPFVHVGDMAEVSGRGESPIARVRARIARTSDQLDPRTRTLFVELEVDNSEGFLVPGAFAYVTLHVPVTAYPEIPVAGLDPARHQYLHRERERRQSGASPSGQGCQHRRHCAPAWRKARRSAIAWRSICPTKWVTAAGCVRSKPIGEPIVAHKISSAMSRSHWVRWACCNLI